MWISFLLMPETHFGQCFVLCMGVWGGSVEWDCTHFVTTTTLECHQLPCFLIATDTPTTLGVCTTPCPLEGLFLLSLCTFVWTKPVCRGGWVKYDIGGFLHIPRTQVAGQWIPFSILHLAVGNCQPSKQVQKPMWGSQKEISPHFSRQCHLTTFYVFTADKYFANDTQ